MFKQKVAYRSSFPAPMIPEVRELFRAHGIPTWAARVAEVVAGVVSAHRRTERDRLAEVASSQRNHSLDGRMPRAEFAAFLRMSIRNVQRYQKRGKLQRAPKFGPKVVYYFRDVRGPTWAIRCATPSRVSGWSAAADLPPCNKSSATRAS